MGIRMLSLLLLCSLEGYAKDTSDTSSCASPVASSALIQQTGAIAVRTPAVLGPELQLFQTGTLEVPLDFSALGKLQGGTGAMISAVVGVCWMLVATAWVYNKHSSLQSEGKEPQCGILSCLCCLCFTPFVFCFPIDAANIVGEAQSQPTKAQRLITNCC
eukprot:TRINITY_DN16196_c0_g1_i2.p1 TRINITY_DN16196_c0_g1~~TRINITY_DN16196_c0_g1_i2.p1  ORF type:complete len:187 (+),score=27.97 TRINITY_DN16196_c0_g1_i2:83-562(+)